MKYHIIWILLSMLFLCSCKSDPFQSEYFEFASEDDSISYRAKIKSVPDHVNDSKVRLCRDGIYQNRQIVYKGIRGDDLVASVFKYNNNRVIWTTEKPMNQYIAEFIVPEPNDYMLDTATTSGVLRTFNLDTTIVNKVADVYILEGDAESIRLPVDNDEAVFYSWDPGEISGQGMTAAMIVNAVDNLESTDLPVLNNLDTEKRYEVELEWTPGNVQDLINKLAEVGLDLTKTKHEISYLKVMSAQ